MPEIKKIILFSLSFSTESVPEKNKLNLNIDLIDFQIQQPQKDGEKYVQMASATFDLRCLEEERLVFNIRARYDVLYTDNELKNFEVLKEIVILAHIIPYFRELISSITMRSVFPPLWLQTINTHAMFEKYQNVIGNKSSTSDQAVPDAEHQDIESAKG